MYSLRQEFDVDRCWISGCSARLDGKATSMNWPSASTATPAGLGTSPHSLCGALAEQRGTPSTFQDHGLECPNNPQTVGKVPRRPRASPDPAAEAFTRSCRTSEKCEHSVTTVSQLTFQVRASLGPVMSWYVSSWGTSRRRWPWRDAEEQASDTCTWTLAFASGLPLFPGLFWRRNAKKLPPICLAEPHARRAALRCMCCWPPARAPPATPGSAAA